LIAGLNAGEAYFNIHTNVFPGGEIRAFLTQTPLPGALSLFGTGLALLALVGRSKRRRLAAA